MKYKQPTLQDINDYRDLCQKLSNVCNVEIKTLKDCLSLVKELQKKNNNLKEEIRKIEANP